MTSNISLKNKILRFIGTVEHAVDMFLLKLKIKYFRSRYTDVKVLSYRGYGRKDFLFTLGRVIRNRGINPKEKDRLDNNLLNSYKRFESDEIPFAKLKITQGTNCYSVSTDEEGYYFLDTLLADKVGKTGWHPIEIELIETPFQANIQKRFQSEVLIPSTNAQYGLISDIDDTVLNTYVTSPFKLKALYSVFLKNATKRTPLKNVNILYRAFQNGTIKGGLNPIFYVSNSPWNLYNYLDEFLRINQLPKGPVLLRDFGISHKKEDYEKKSHKYESIAKILKTYPELPFILFGDSGEKDANIYLDIERHFPDRISAIYIRDVQDKSQTARIQQLIQKSSFKNILLVKNSLEAAIHAARKGWIPHATVEQLKTLEHV